MTQQRKRLIPLLLLLRSWSGDTQKALAVKCGVSPSVVSHYERSRKELSTDWLRKIAKAYNFNYIHLITLLSEFSTDDEKAQSLFIIFETMKQNRKNTSEIGMIFAMFRALARFDEAELARRLQRVSAIEVPWTSKIVTYLENGTARISQSHIKTYAIYFKIPRQYLTEWSSIQTSEEKQELLYELYKISKQKGALLI